MLKCVLLVAGILIAGSGFAAEIALKNAGFEQAMVGKRIPGWSRTQHAGVRAYAVDTDSSEVAEGKHSIRMQRTAQQVWGMIMQRIESKDLAGKAIEISAKLKTMDVGKGGWVMVMTFRNHQNMLDQVRTEPLTGDTKWTDVVLKGNAPARTNAIDIGFMLLDEGTGWIDQVRLRSLDEDSKERPESEALPTKESKHKG